MNVAVEMHDQDLARRLREVGRNFTEIGITAENTYDAVEEREAALFNALNGRYIRTGATLASLTDRRADRAIREAHGNTIRFGTRVYYVKYLHNPPVVVGWERHTAQQIARASLREIMEPVS